jgi:FkbM family methyltransferase
MDSTDFETFRQIFVWQRYKPVTEIEDPEVIVDCGANAGYSALFFLKHFPRAHVIAVEPNPANAQLCRHNLRFYGSRSVVFQKAIWGKVGKLAFVEETCRPGNEWGIQVHVSDANTTVDAIDVPTTGVRRIDLLKVDIEKSEASVFQTSPSAWLHLVRNIAIELHGLTCTQIFHQALTNYCFWSLESQCGEVTFCLGIRPTVERSREADLIDEEVCR